MDGKYDVSSISFSLKTMCAVKVTQQVLEASRNKITPELVKSIAINKARQLEIPSSTKDLVESLINPISKELNAWIKLSRGQGDPIWTPQGTINKAQSIKSILKNEKVEKFVRFDLACECCLEESIFQLFHELTVKDAYSRILSHVSLNVPSELVNFWSNALTVQYGKLRLTKKVYNEGFKLAVREKSNIALRYFISKAAVDEMWSHNDSSRYFYNKHLSGDISPANLCLLFSKMSNVQQQFRIAEFSSLLLRSLLEWPYQVFFLDAVHSVAHYLRKEYYFDIIAIIMSKIRTNERDYNYKELFIGLWQVHQSMDSAGYIGKAVSDVIKTGDEWLIASMLAQNTIEENDLLLMEFRTNKICAALILKQEFRILELFIRCCVMNRRNVLSEFKSKFWEKGTDYHESILFGLNYGDLDSWEAGLKEFAKIVDKIMAVI